MKRMNVREFRAKISELTEEPIEVTRYSETVGFWVPQSMTTMPRRPIRPARKISATKLGTLGTTAAAIEDAEVDAFIARMKKFNEEMEKLGVAKKK